MSALTVRLQDAATRISTECKSLRTLLNGNAADLAALTTTVKTNLVAALNEVRAAVVAIDLTDLIDDTETTATDLTWSIDKIVAALAATAIAVKAEILGGADAAHDTLQELVALLDGEAADIASILTALGNRVRVDTAAQGLNDTQKGNARTNIGAVAAADVGNTDTNFVATFEAGLI